MKQKGYAGRRTVGRKTPNQRVPGQPSKHEAWPGVQIDRTKTYIDIKSIRKRAS